MTGEDRPDEDEPLAADEDEPLAADEDEPLAADEDEPSAADEDEPLAADGDGVSSTSQTEAPDDVAVEDATATDVDRLLELWEALVEHGREYGLHMYSGANRLAARETLAAGVADGRVLVARRDGRSERSVVGFCSLATNTGGFDRDVRRGVVENLYVDPVARGSGVGSALLAAGEERLAERGATVVAVEAMAADASVRSFYEDRGFRPHRVAFEKRVDEE